MTGVAVDEEWSVTWSMVERKCDWMEGVEKGWGQE
jgi:hypothetical protein